MPHPVVITLLFHPEDPSSVVVSERFVAHFDKLGMRRAGINMRVPIRFRSEAFQPDGALQSLRGEGELLDVIVVLHGPDMDLEPTPWKALCANARTRFKAARKTFSSLVVTMDSSLRDLRFFSSSKGQQVRWFDWQGLAEAERTTRLMIHVVNHIRRQLTNLGRKREKIFVSHAKLDGAIAAERIVGHINNPTANLKLDTFYDAQQLESGEDWKDALKYFAKSGSLIAVVTDAYDERPWCNQEILWAKENRRPILMVDVGRSRVDRSFPYAGNVPLMRDELASTAAIERLLLELLSEALRCDLFQKTAGGQGRRVRAATPARACRPRLFPALSEGRSHGLSRPAAVRG